MNLSVKNISIIDIFKKYGDRRERDFTPDGAGRYKTICHAHKDSDPSLKIYDKTAEGKGWDFHCFVCKAHGDGMDLMVQLGVAKDKAEAECKLRKDFNMELPEKVDIETFCNLKGINIDTAKQNGWEDKDNGMEITYYDQSSRVIGRKIRTKYRGKNKYYYVSHPSYTNDQPYGLHWLPAYNTEEPIYITEGETDAITIKQAGFQSLGIPSTNAWKDEFSSLVQDFSRVVVVIDNDEAGERLLKDISNSVPDKLYVKLLPNAIKDINDYHIFKCASLIDTFKEKFPTLKEVPATSSTFIEECKLHPETIDDISNWFVILKELNTPLKKDKFIKEVHKITNAGVSALRDTVSLIESENRFRELPDWYIQTKAGIKLNSYLYSQYLSQEKNLYIVKGLWYLYKDGVYKQVTEAHIKSVIIDNLIDECKSEPQNVRDTLFFLQSNSELFHDETDFDTDPFIMNLHNGLLDIRTMKLSEHSPAHLSMHQLNVSYDSENVDYTYLDKYLSDKIPDHENQLLAQEILGYSISSFNSAEKWFMLYGGGRSGKGTFLNIIEEVLGKDMVSNVDLQKLGDRFSSSRLLGKLANIQADLPSDPIRDNAVSMLKRCIGRDGVDAEFKGVDGFKFMNKATMLFGCNKLPQNTGDNAYSSFWEKLVILPMPHSNTQDVDVNFKFNLVEKESLNAVFLWALDGLKRLYANDFSFSTSTNATQLKQEYREQSSNVIRFALECCEAGDEEDGYYVLSTELMRYYQEWCRLDGSSPKRSDNVVTELKDFYYTSQGITIDKAKKRHSGGNRAHFIGLRLIDESEF